MTGYRDYMWRYHEKLLQLADDAGFSEDQIFFRESNCSHELYGWIYPEMWEFLSEGNRPDRGTLAPDWYIEETAIDHSLLALAMNQESHVLAVGEAG